MSCLYLNLSSWYPCSPLVVGMRMSIRGWISVPQFLSKSHCQCISCSSITWYFFVLVKSWLKWYIFVVSILVLMSDQSFDVSGNTVFTMINNIAFPSYWSFKSWDFFNSLNLHLLSVVSKFLIHRIWALLVKCELLEGFICFWSIIFSGLSVNA